LPAACLGGDIAIELPGPTSSLPSRSSRGAQWGSKFFNHLVLVRHRPG